MPDDTIMTLYRQGLTRAEIAAQTGRTKNAVIGYIWRYQRQGKTAAKPKLPEREVILATIKAHGGSVVYAARALGVSRHRLYSAGYRGRTPAMTNMAQEADTVKLIEEINASGLSDAYIAREVDMPAMNIYNWRYGKCRVSPFLAQCVRMVLKKNTPSS